MFQELGPPRFRCFEANTAETNPNWQMGVYGCTRSQEWRLAMRSVSQGRKFDTLDLEMLDRVYSLACLYMEADNLCCTTVRDKAAEKDALRRQIFALADGAPAGFDALFDKVLASWSRARRTTTQRPLGTREVGRINLSL
jgi:hypothetical protein